jgi:hypothetical protein
MGTAESRLSSNVGDLFARSQANAAQALLAYAQENTGDYDALDDERDNILGAADLCLVQENWQLLAEFTKTLTDYLVTKGHWIPYVRYARILLDTDALQENSERVDVLGRLAAVEEAQGNYAEARRLYRQQLQLYSQAQTTKADLVIATLRQLVRLAKLQDDDREAQRFLERQLEIVGVQQNPREQVDIRLELAELYQKRHDLDHADLLCQQALMVAERIGYRVGLVDTLRQQASIRYDKRNLEDARELYRAALDAALEIGDQVRASEIRDRLVALEAIMGRNVFISYNHHDHGFAERLAQDLKAAGFAVWWDEWEIKVGDSIIQKVSQGINESAYLPVVLSPHSVKSNWVQRELGSALMRQLSADRDITVFPLLVADCEVPALLREIRWADFRQDYQAGLGELLDVLLGHGV